jgi:acyl-CoA thioester hydrolase
MTSFGAFPLEHALFKTPVAVRFKDLDAMGHVNNAVYATYFEEARAAFARRVLGLTRLDAFDFVVARLEIDFRRPLLYGEELEAALWIGRMGQRSFTLEYRLTSGSDTVAEGRSVQVFYDYAAGSPKAIPAGFLEKAAPYTAQEAP